MKKKHRSSEDEANTAATTPVTVRDNPAGLPLWLRMILVVVMGYHFAVLAYVAHNRLTYSAIIDESEDIHARCAQTLAIGESLYGPESVHIQRKDYTPLSFWFLSKALKYLGPDIRYQRAMSLLFGLGAIVLIGACAKKLTGSTFWGFMAAALMAGIDTGIWYMEVGPQPFHVFFAVLGLYLLVRDPSYSTRTVILSGLAFFCCYFSKQTGLAYLAVYVFVMFINDRKKGLIALGIAAGLVLGSSLYLATRPDSDFVRLVFLWNALDPLVWSRLWSPILFPEMSGRFGILAAVVIGTLFMISRDNWKQWFTPAFLMMLGGLAAGNFASMKMGSGNVQVIVGYGGLIVVGMLLIHRYMSTRVIPAGLAGGMLTVAGLSLVHPVSSNVIVPDDQFRYERMINLIKESPGEVKFFMIGYYNVLAGKTAYTDPFIDSVRRQQDGTLRYRPYWEEYLKSIPWDTIITAVPMEYNTSLLQPMLEKHYRVREEFPATGREGGIIRRRLIVLDKIKPGATGPVR